MKGGFLMERAEDDNPVYLADDLGISLHALTFLSSPNTLQLIITITGMEHRALVDSGSRHMFIHDAVVHRLGFQVAVQLGLSVKVANGSVFRVMVHAKL
jgi:hypothetical protein